MSLSDEAEKLGFEYCNKCRLIWCDNIGYGNTGCPRCDLGQQVDTLYDKCADLENQLSNSKSEKEELLDALDDIQRRLKEFV